MKKRIISLLLCVVMLLCAISLSVSAVVDKDTETEGSRSAFWTERDLYSKTTSKTTNLSCEFDNAEQAIKFSAAGDLSGGTKLQITGVFDESTRGSGAVYKYMAIKYKYSGVTTNAGLSLNRMNVQSLDNQTLLATKYKTSRSVDGAITTVADGEWHTAVIDMTTVDFEATGSDIAYGKTWDKYSYTYFQILPWKWAAVTQGSEFYISSFGFFEDKIMAEDALAGYSRIYTASDLESITSVSDKDGKASIALENGALVMSHTAVVSGIRVVMDFNTELPFMVLKCKYGGTGYIPDLKIMYWDGALSTPKTCEKALNEENTSEWQVVTQQLIGFTNGSSWSSKNTTQIQLCPYQWTSGYTTESTFSVESIAFFKTAAASAAYAKAIALNVNASNCTADVDAKNNIINVSNIPSGCDKIKVFDGAELVKSYDVTGTEHSFSVADLGAHTNVTVSAENSATAQFRGWQVKPGSGEATKAIRFVGTIDDIENVDSVGFEVSTVYNNQNYSWETQRNIVYTSLTANEETLNASSLGGNKIFVLVIDNIPDDVAATELEFEVVTYTTVNGETTEQTNTFKVMLATVQ